MVIISMNAVTARKAVPNAVRRPARPLNCSMYPLTTSPALSGSMFARRNAWMCSPSPEKTGNADISVSMIVTSGTSASSVVNVRLDAICRQRSCSKRRYRCAKNRPSCSRVELMGRILRECARGQGSALRVDALHLVLQPVQGVDVRLRRRHDDVGVGPDAVDDPSALGEPDRHLALRLGALSHGVDRVKLELRAARRHGLDRLEDRIHRPVALRRGRALRTGVRQHDARVRPLAGAALLLQLYELRAHRRRSFGFVRHQDVQVNVEDLVLLVGELLETLESLVVRVVGLEVDAQLLEALLEGAASRMLAEDQLVR